MDRAELTVGVRTGLTSAEAARRLSDVGPNTLPTAPGPSPWRELARQFTHLLALLLIVASGLALVGGLPALAVAIAVVVVLHALFAFWQEWRADRSAARLRALLPARVRVRRDGELHTIDAVGLVPGDVVEVAAGDRLAADHELLSSEELRVDESLVTGESEAVTHAAGDRLRAGTFVVQGEGEALVTATGRDTTLAEISDLAAHASRPPSPMSVELAGVVRVVAMMACATGAALGLGGLALGLTPTSAFLFAVGVTVALVPEGLLPTVTLSLARGAQLMAHRNALVRRLDAVETLGATTFICTDKTGTLTQNRMSVVAVWTPAGTVEVSGVGYEPEGRVGTGEEDRRALREVAGAATRCVTGRVEQREGTWQAQGDPMEAAIHCAALRAGASTEDEPSSLGLPWSSERMMSAVVADGRVHVLGAPERVMERCEGDVTAGLQAVHALTGRGLRVLAVASQPWHGETDPALLERDLHLIGLLGLKDPPRPDVREALADCVRADIRVAMLTGDHPRTAEAIGREIGLLRGSGTVLDGRTLPEDDASLGAALDQPDGVVVARVTPADKLRITRALRGRGHVVAMTGDGVNDAPALREADVGVAMGASGSDVAREAADLVLLDDHFGTIVTAVELGRATFANVRRFLTYHLTDNVAELAPFAAWALTGGRFPLAIGVLQVLALDIGTDMLPALALGTEPPSPGGMEGRGRSRSIVDRRVLTRAFMVLGPTEAVAALAAFAAVLLAGGWRWGAEPGAALLAGASGTAFSTIALAQMANAFACRSDAVPVWRTGLRGNPALLAAVGTELVLLLVIVGVAPVAELLGGSWPSLRGWSWALLGAVLLVAADAVHKTLRRARGSRQARRPGRRPASDVAPDRVGHRAGGAS